MFLNRNEIDQITTKFYWKAKAPFRAYILGKPPSFKAWLKRMKKKYKKIRNFNVENPIEFMKREIPTTLQAILYPDIKLFGV